MTDNTKAIIEEVIACEKQRCKALQEDDYVTLLKLLSEDLTHTHTRGNVDGLNDYLAYLGKTIKLINVSRKDDLNVRLYGDIAVMTGTQVNLATTRVNPGDPITIESTTIQVWKKNTDQWQVVAFQATSLGPPPPAVKRE